MTEMRDWGHKWHHATIAWRQEVAAAFKSLGRDFTSQVENLETGPDRRPRPSPRRCDSLPTSHVGKWRRRYYVSPFASL